MDDSDLDHEYYRIITKHDYDSCSDYDSQVYKIAISVKTLNSLQLTMF